MKSSMSELDNKVKVKTCISVNSPILFKANFELQMPVILRRVKKDLRKGELN